MATLKVGDRVRILRGVNLDKEATVIGPLHSTVLHSVMTGKKWKAMAYDVDVDGTPVPQGFSRPWAYMPQDLAPILPPDSAEWAQSKVRDLFKPTYLEPERVKERA